MRVRRSNLLGAALGLMGVAACFSERPSTAPENPTPSGSSDISIDNFAFVPPDISVPVGTVVTWTNVDATIHTVSSDDGTTFDSGAFMQGKTFEFTAARPGVITYFCRIHPFMRARLTVTP